MAFHPTRKRNELIGISLCSGVGGLDLGLHIAEPRYRTVCFVERNSFAAAALVARMADTSLAPAPIWDDLKTFEGRRWRGRVHILTAGYPCQPFSLSGLRKGQNDPRHLWPDVARIIGEVSPKWVFLENVPGHLTLGFQDVVRDLQAMGYSVAARVVSAAEVGGSHTRERLFILAHADIQIRRQQSLHKGQLSRDPIHDRSEPEWQSNRPQERRECVDTYVGHDDSGWMDPAELPGFPPLPGDLAQWGETLNQFPHLKPCLYRLDDGVASGLDRSSAAGNGVVPLAAAYAYSTLRAELSLALQA